MKPHIKRYPRAPNVWQATWGHTTCCGDTPTIALRNLYRYLLHYGRQHLWPAAIVHNMVKSYA